MLVAGQVLLRAPEDPPPVSGIVDVVLEQGGGFGSGAHPTTRMCVELMLGVEPAGGLGDVGCGLGALAIAAAKLGFAPLIALDREENAIAAARANAERNGVAVECRVANAEEEPPPALPTLVVNAPPTVHEAVAQKLDPATRTVVVSGAVGPEIGPVVEAYEQSGLTEDRRLEDESGIWCAVLLRRPGAIAPTCSTRTARPKPAPSSARPPRARPGAACSIASARFIEHGVRTTVALAPGLFRVDIYPSPESLGLHLRDLSGYRIGWQASTDAWDLLRRGDTHEPIIMVGELATAERHLMIELRLIMIGDLEAGGAYLCARAAIRDAPPPEE